MRPWQSRLGILFALLAVFAAGGVAGWSYGRQDGSRRGPRSSGRSEDMPERIITGLTRDLELKPEQRTKMEPIVRETWGKINDAQKSCGRQIRELVKAQHEQFKGFLDEAQWAKLQELEARRARRHGTNGPGGRMPGPAAQPRP